LHLFLVGAGADDEVVGERGDAGEVEYDQVGCFFRFCCADGNQPGWRGGLGSGGFLEIGLGQNRLLSLSYYGNPNSPQSHRGCDEEVASSEFLFLWHNSVRIYTYRRDLSLMPDSLASLEAKRAQLLGQFLSLGDLRPGCITAVVRRCGKPTCHCAKPNDPGHDPQFRLTHRVAGKTVTETFPSPPALRKAQQEISEFHRFQELSQELNSPE